MDAQEKEQSLQDLFMKLTHLYFKKAFAALKETGIHPRQVPLMGLVLENPGISQKEISQTLNISPPTVAVSIKRMEKSGILVRKVDERDQRMCRIYLTDEGRAITEKVKKFVGENKLAVFKGFSDSELCLMKRFFCQMIENLEREEK